jgi:hypothetical protein
MTLTLISVENEHYVYEDQDGSEVLLAGLGPMFRRVTFWDDFDLQAAWHTAQANHRETGGGWRGPDRVKFVLDLRLLIADPGSVEVEWCQDCELPIKSDVVESTRDGYVCETCYEDYRDCDDCGVMVHYESTVYALSDETVCQRCSDHHYLFCDECDGYFHADNDGEHEHGGCDCESPAQVFSMRNDGEPVLNQDERVTIALPSGVISQEGIDSIVQLVMNQGYNIKIDYNLPHDEAEVLYAERTKWWTLARELDTLGDTWQTKEGNYTKRLSKLAHKSQGLKFPPELLSQVGCIARDNSTGVDFQVEVTRNLNLPAEDFYHEDSCWWQSYSESRCALKSNGGIGMRTFSNEYGYDRVRGRAWIMPLRLDGDGELQATFDSLTPDAFIVFNGYGDLSGYAPARIVAHMAGMTYRKIGFDCSPMYVNNNSGYLVASEEIAEKYATAGALHLCVDTHSFLHFSESRALVNA